MHIVATHQASKPSAATTFDQFQGLVRVEAKVKDLSPEEQRKMCKRRNPPGSAPMPKMPKAGTPPLSEASPLPGIQFAPKASAAVFDDFSLDASRLRLPRDSTVPSSGEPGASSSEVTPITPGDVLAHVSMMATYPSETSPVSQEATAPSTSAPSVAVDTLGLEPPLLEPQLPDAGTADIALPASPRLRPSDVQDDGSRKCPRTSLTSSGVGADAATALTSSGVATCDPALPLSASLEAQVAQAAPTDAQLPSDTTGGPTSLPTTFDITPVGSFGPVEHRDGDGVESTVSYADTAGSFDRPSPNDLTSPCADPQALPPLLTASTQRELELLSEMARKGPGVGQEERGHCSHG